MPRRAPPPREPASMETRAQYFREGRRLLNRAMVDYPALDPVAALIAHQQEAGPLDPSSVLVYRAALRRILSVVLRAQGRADEFAALWPLLDAALTARKRRIAQSDKRTSAKKVVDATNAEAAALFSELKRHALKSGNLNAVLAGLFTLVAGHAGFRPIELIGAELDGAILALPNAKRGKSQAARRQQDLGSLHADVRIGLVLLIGLIDHDMSRRRFKMWEKCLAEQIRRACKRIGIRVLAPYSFRHIAIATWSKAGLSPSEIARLCGHVSIRTAHTHYARAKVGHERKAIARAVLSPDLEREAEASQAVQAAPGAEGAMDGNDGRTGAADLIFDFDDMPVPVALRRNGPEPLSAEAVQAAFARYGGDSDIAGLGERIRAAQQRRLDAEERGEPAKPAGLDDQS